MKTFTSPMLLADGLRMRQYEGGLTYSADYEAMIERGIQSRSITDSEEETIAKALSTACEPGADVITRSCGCRTAFLTPYTFGCKKYGGYVTSGRTCEPRAQSLAELATIHDLMVAVNAVKYCRANLSAPRAHRHAVLAAAGLPFDDGVILDYYKSRRYDGRRESREVGNVACALHASFMLTGLCLDRRSAVDDVPELAPYMSIGVYATQRDADEALVDYKRYLEVR